LAQIEIGYECDQFLCWKGFALEASQRWRRHTASFLVQIWLRDRVRDQASIIEWICGVRSKHPNMQ